MILTQQNPKTLNQEVVHAFDAVNGGVHPGFRPAHGKGILLTGVFSPSAAGSALTRARHVQNDSTPITVRFSDFAGIPAIPDHNENASPRGIAIRFHLGEHVHTDIVAHSVNGFPSRTAEEFVQFLTAADRVSLNRPLSKHSSVPIPALLNSSLLRSQSPKASLLNLSLR